MWFWIPLVSVVLLTILLGWIITTLYDLDAQGFVGFLIGLSWIAVFVIMAIGPGLTNDWSYRDLTSEKLIPFEDGEYIHTAFTEEGAVISYQTKSADGSILPYTVDDDSVVIVYGGDGEIAQNQEYYDNPAVWPWFYEGYSTTELRIPK